MGCTELVDFLVVGIPNCKPAGSEAEQQVTHDQASHHIMWHRQKQQEIMEGKAAERTVAYSDAEIVAKVVWAKLSQRSRNNAKT